MYQIGAVILAAGVPKRHETYKPLLCIGDSTIIRYTAELMKASGVEKILIVTGHHRELIEKHLDDLDVDFLYNTDYAGTQMYDSAMMGLLSLEKECRRILLSPVDVPLVRIQTTKKMIAEDGDVVIPVCNGKEGHPILINSAVVPIIAEIGGSGGLTEAIHSPEIKIKTLNVDDEGVIFNADLPQEYTRLLRHNTALKEDGEVGLRLEFKTQIVGDEPIFDSASARFLELIQLTGSMQMACSCMHMSYSKGWKTINHIEKQLNIRILLRTRGGTEGGGSRLTAEGEDLLQRFQGMKEEVCVQSNNIYRKWFDGFSGR